MNTTSRSDRRGRTALSVITAGITGGAILVGMPLRSMRSTAGNDYAAAVTYFSDTLYVSILGAPVLPGPVRHHGQQRRTPTQRPPNHRHRHGPVRPSPIWLSHQRLLLAPNPHHHSQVTMTLRSSTAPSPRGLGP